MSVQQLAEHLMELGIKPHQSKTAAEAAYNWAVTAAHALDQTASPTGREAKKGRVLLEAPCTSFLPQPLSIGSGIHSNLFKLHKALHRLSFRKQEREADPSVPSGQMEERGPGLPPGCRAPDERLTARCNHKVRAQGRSRGNYFLLNCGCRYSQRKAAGIQELLISQHDFH